MTVPVVCSLAKQYPDVQITVLSRKNFGAIFQNLPQNIHFQGIDLKDYDGLRGLNRLYKELEVQQFDYVADLHDVLRTKYLRIRFRLAGTPVATIDKGRKEKKKLTRRNHKILKQLDTSFVRYKKVLEKLGFKFHLNFTSIYGNKSADISAIESITGQKGADRWIGIAPFAKHEGKAYPPELLQEVIGGLLKTNGVKLFLFGGGEHEKQIVEKWKQKYPAIVNIIGKLSFGQELALLSNMDVVLSMDSANMHLASMVGTTVVSVWGATHPYAGFMGWNQKEENAVQTDLHCRPCSVFGQKPCYRGDYACMYGISPQQVINKVEEVRNKTEETR
ncbi:glycosyltransferase family 9 protein [Paludibacter sp. 221]|uniref:glycosyltransferase family 9 protein n=1 Tax=Paludibacter sp. 221 TaxID=2302939 RepID=UPI0013D81CA3|nr:glycosyltransferase family 9 protein [Paludibacter sp. 221]NDV47507.1 glycosyltransferase family 9 protein [Paludibacter sp. 221]